MAKYQPGSKRGSVHQVYDQEGEAAARAKAEALGIPDSKIKRWLRMWSGKEEAPPDALDPIVRSRPRGGKNRVQLIGAKHVVGGTIITHGEEQSEVKWDNGNRVIVANTWLAPLEEDS